MNAKVLAVVSASIASMSGVPLYRERDTSPKGVVEPVKRRTVRTGRNEPCPCGSGQKSKRCCREAK